MQDQENQAVPNQEAEPVQAQPAAPAEPAVPSLEEQLASAEARAAEMQDAFMRAKAEADNIRRRAQEDVSKASPKPWCRSRTAWKWP